MINLNSRQYSVSLRQPCWDQLASLQVGDTFSWPEYFQVRGLSKAHSNYGFFFARVIKKNNNIYYLLSIYNHSINNIHVVKHEAHISNQA